MLMSTLDLTDSAHLVQMPATSFSGGDMDRLLGSAKYVEYGLAVLATETSTDVWTISTFPGEDAVYADSDQQYSEDYIFYGGRSYEVTGSLADALNAAGYSVMPSFSSGFSGGFEIAI